MGILEENPRKVTVSGTRHHTISAKKRELPKLIAIVGKIELFCDVFCISLTFNSKAHKREGQEVVRE